VTRCAGIDGCPRGWIVASDDGVDVVASLSGLIDRFDVIGIDMPIGLPDSGPRAADVAARQLLSPRSSTVFPALLRPLIDVVDYDEANARSRAIHGKGLSKQAFMLRARTVEVDALVDPSLEHRIVEVHPECSFRLMAGQTIPSKHTPEGLAERRALVTAHVGPLPPCPAGARDDDLLDAHAALWSARRFAAGRHVTLPDELVERDARGLVMRIVA
jgi:predicted RNase H-like nuclease